MATKKPKPPPDDPEQSQRFEQAARDVEADPIGRAFKRALDKIVPTQSRRKKR